MGNPGLLEGLVIPGCALDVAIFRGGFGGEDGKCFLIGKFDGTGFEPGSTDDIVTGGGRYRVKAQCGEDEPGGHLSAVFIAAQSVRFMGVEVIHDLADALLGFPWFADKIVEVGYVMAGFVAVCVLSD